MDIDKEIKTVHPTAAASSSLSSSSLNLASSTPSSAVNIYDNKAYHEDEGNAKIKYDKIIAFASFLETITTSNFLYPIFTIFEFKVKRCDKKIFFIMKSYSYYCKYHRKDRICKLTQTFFFKFIS